MGFTAFSGEYRVLNDISITADNRSQVNLDFLQHGWTTQNSSVKGKWHPPRHR